jgi:hypothetical protein
VRRAVLGVMAGLLVAGGVASSAIVVRTPDLGPTPTATPGADTANCWVNTTAGASPARLSTAGVYDSTKAYGSFDAAWDACSAGDMIRVKNGTYARQFITGDKASTTKIIGESKAGVIVTGTDADCKAAFGASTILCPDGNFAWIENVTVDANSNDGPVAGALIAADNVTLKNVDILGDAPDIGVGNVDGSCTGCSAANFTWDGGTYGDVSPPPRPCISAPGSYGEPVWVYFTGATINNVVFNKQFVELETTHGGSCAVGDNGHLEFVRGESAATNVTVSNNVFKCGSDSGSGFIFGSTNTMSGLRIIGNYFCDNDGSTWVQIKNIACGAVVAYNTFNPNGGALLDTADFTSGTGCNPTWTGNLGNDQGCGGTHAKNVWSGTGSCGTDTFAGATSLAIDGTTGHIGSGSPAIDAAEATSSLTSVDIDGDPRPCGAALDAGADERC